jgi:tetratricopeptide (TPR) repeat protein
MAVSMFEETLEYTPDGHPNKLLCFTLLGTSLRRQFERFEDVDDINGSLSVLRAAIQHLADFSDVGEAVRELREAVQFLPADHLAKPSTLKLLGDSLLLRFERLSDLNDIQEALLILTEAANLSPDIDPNNDLAYCLVCRFWKVGDLTDLRDAVMMFESSAGLSDDSRESAQTHLWLSISN